jgi:hypothetical protein
MIKELKARMVISDKVSAEFKQKNPAILLGFLWYLQGITSAKNVVFCSA